MQNCFGIPFLYSSLSILFLLLFSQNSSPFLSHTKTNHFSQMFHDNSSTDNSKCYFYCSTWDITHQKLASSLCIFIYLVFYMYMQKAWTKQVSASITAVYSQISGWLCCTKVQGWCGIVHYGPASCGHQTPLHLCQELSYIFRTVKKFSHEAILKVPEKHTANSCTKILKKT